MPEYDFFAVLEQRDAPDLDRWLRDGRADLYSCLQLLHARACRREQDSVGAKSAHKAIVHQKGNPKLSRYGRSLLGAALEQIRSLGMVGLRADSLEALPEETVLCEFDFVLEKKYLSRDDCAFYPADNPVRKERIFKIPMIPGSGWKGSLRAAAVEGLFLRNSAPGAKVDERVALVGIFGDEKGAELDEDEEAREHTPAAFLDGEFQRLGILEAYRQGLRECYQPGAEPEDELHRQGRLRFLPSYFDGIGLDVINPRRRTTRTGTIPIAMEIVPAGCEARFSLLYLPYDLLGRPRAEILGRQRDDWKLIGEALLRMFRYTGFGAKKSSGCGKAAARISNLRFESLMTGFRTPRATDNLDDLINLYRCFEVNG